MNLHEIINRLVSIVYCSRRPNYTIIAGKIKLTLLKITNVFKKHSADVIITTERGCFNI